MSFDMEKIAQWANSTTSSDPVAKVSSLKRLFQGGSEFNDAQILSLLLETVKSHAQLETKLTATGLENLRTVANGLGVAKTGIVGKAVAHIRGTSSSQLAGEIDAKVLKVQEEKLFRLLSLIKLTEEDIPQLTTLIQSTLPRLSADRRKEFYDLFLLHGNASIMLLSSMDTQVVKAFMKELFKEGFLIVAFSSMGHAELLNSPQIQQVIKEVVKEEVKIQPMYSTKKSAYSIHLPKHLSKQQLPPRDSLNTSYIILSSISDAVMEAVKGQFALTDKAAKTIPEQLRSAIERKESSITFSDEDGLTLLRETKGFELVTKMKNTLERFIPKDSKNHAKLVELLKAPMIDKNFKALFGPLDKLIDESQFKPALMESILKEELPKNLEKNKHFVEFVKALQDYRIQKMGHGNYVDPLKRAREALEHALKETDYQSDAVTKYRQWCQTIEDQKPDFLNI